MSRFEQQLEDLNRDHFRFGVVLNAGCFIAGVVLSLLLQAVANS